MRTVRTQITIALAAIVPIAGCGGADLPAGAESVPATAPAAAGFTGAGLVAELGVVDLSDGADVARAWARLGMLAGRDEGHSPPAVARIAGYLGVALHEGFVGATDPARTIADGLNGRPALPAAPGTAELDPVVAMSAATSLVLTGLFDTATSHDAFVELHDSVAGASEADKDTVAASIAWGTSVGEFVLAWSRADRSDEVDTATFEPTGAEGAWEPTPPGFEPALEPGWRDVRTFIGEAVCPLDPPPEFDLSAGSEFRTSVDELFALSGELTDDQRLIADYWNDPPLSTTSPPGHWIQIAADVTFQRGLSETATVEILAGAGIALADAAVAVWHWKYEYDMIRPINAIRGVSGTDWIPYITTPPFPEYPSGHSAFSSAAARVLSGLTADEGFVDRTNADRFGERRFDSYQTAAEEAGMSRLYGGIHFDFGNLAGRSVGRCHGDRAVALIRQSSAND